MIAMFCIVAILTRLLVYWGGVQLLQSVSGAPVSVPMTIVISGIAKMFVGELVEIGMHLILTNLKNLPLALALFCIMIFWVPLIMLSSWILRLFISHGVS